MSIAFLSPTARAAAGGDLAVSMGPLGLLDLTSEEWDVHGYRLSRYASQWAFYLGQHWTHRREQGEAQLTMNYVKAIADYKINFTFGKGIQFTAPEQNAAITPALLQLVWTQHNNKEHVLREMAQYGSVLGDAIIKVAFEPPYLDSTGLEHEGKIRIIPINPGQSFPIWHPHDRSRMLQHKLKYRFHAPDATGTMVVHTYVEVCTDEEILEFIDDSLFSQRPNPLGRIPYVHIPNQVIAGSPWGQSDIWDLLSINRTYNEMMTEFMDIINYNASPVTVMTGAKANDLIRGKGRVWAVGDPAAKIYNLEMRTDLAPLIEALTMLKRSMHEMSGVPETALGQTQAISNTSGVALSIQFQPLMNAHEAKKAVYGEGISQVNELIILTAALYRPDLLQWNPSMVTQPEPDQLMVLDPRDANIYITSVKWPDPLPVDKLIKLNEENMKMQMGLQSKRGALAELGNEAPNDKMAEIFEEQKRDAIEAGALQLIQADVMQTILAQTGMLADGGGGFAPPPPPPTEGGGTSGGGGSGAPGAIPLGVESQLANELLTQAYGTKIPQRTTPTSDE